MLNFVDVELATRRIHNIITQERYTNTHTWR